MAPIPTVIVLVSFRLTASITLTRLPLQLGAAARMVRWFTPAGQLPSAAYALVPSESAVTEVGEPETATSLSFTGSTCGVDPRSIPLALITLMLLLPVLET